jgi:hypothetical protein
MHIDDVSTSERISGPAGDLGNAAAPAGGAVN